MDVREDLILAEVIVQPTSHTSVNQVRDDAGIALSTLQSTEVVREHGVGDVPT